MHNDYVYKDRKMMKWIPFHALLEQGDYVRDLLEGRMKKEMPILSYDQQEELNYQMETAFIFKTEIIVTYFQNSDYHDIQGQISRIDMHNRVLYIDETPVNAQTIIQIELV